MHDHPRDCKKRGKEKIFPRLDARSPRIPGSCVPTAIHVFNRPDTLRLLVARTLNRRRFQFVHLDFVLIQWQRGPSLEAVCGNGCTPGCCPGSTGTTVPLHRTGNRHRVVFPRVVHGRSTVCLGQYRLTSTNPLRHPQEGARDFNRWVAECGKVIVGARAHLAAAAATPCADGRVHHAEGEGRKLADKDLGLGRTAAISADVGAVQPRCGRHCVGRG